MLRRRFSAGARQSNPYSCIDSFFPTGDPVKDMLTLKNTMYNAQIRANNAPVTIPNFNIKLPTDKIEIEEEETKVSSETLPFNKEEESIPLTK